jgi:hypothetical protein
MKWAASRAEFLFILLFDPEDRGDVVFRNVGRLSPDCKELYVCQNTELFNRNIYPNVL